MKPGPKYPYVLFFDPSEGMVSRKGKVKDGLKGVREMGKCLARERVLNDQFRLGFSGALREFHPPGSRLTGKLEWWFGFLHFG